MQMQLELGCKVPIVIAGDPGEYTTNEVFLIDAIVYALPKLDAWHLHSLYQNVRHEVLKRSSIITNQTKV